MFATWSLSARCASVKVAPVVVTSSMIYTVALVGIAASLFFCTENTPFIFSNRSARCSVVCGLVCVFL